LIPHLILHLVQFRYSADENRSIRGSLAITIPRMITKNWPARFSPREITSDRERKMIRHPWQRGCLSTLITTAFLWLSFCIPIPADEAPQAAWDKIAPWFTPPAEFAKDFGNYKSPLIFEDGSPVESKADWPKRRQEILEYWHKAMGPWPALIERPKLEILHRTARENFIQQRVRVEIAPGQMTAGYLLIPEGSGPFPAVVVPYYEPESSIGEGKVELRDFGYQLARRGFVTLSIGSPGGDARLPETGEAKSQPLSFLAYAAANCANALATLPEVDSKRIGVVGHSYGGKWAMFASCLHEKFAAAAWSDGGIVFDESRPNVNYWEPWYLGQDPEQKRKPGVPTSGNPRTGPYKELFESGRDLHELHALMAPRPFLVSGGSEDPPMRWRALNHAVAVNRLLGHTNRVAMTNRKAHNPNPESNEQIYLFFEYFLKGKGD
jgi:dienelactone hydrolase